MPLFCCLLLSIFTLATATISEALECNSFTVREAMPALESPETGGFEKLSKIKPVDNEKDVWVKKEILLNGSAIKAATLGHSEPFFTKEEMEVIKNDPSTPPASAEREKAFTTSYPLINITYKNHEAISKLSALGGDKRVAFVYKNKIIEAVTLISPVQSLETSIMCVFSEEQAKQFVDIINSFSTCE